MKHTADDLLNNIKNENSENVDGIMYLISNIDKLKYLSLGNQTCERREAIVRHVLSLYPKTNRNIIERILTKNFIFSNDTFKIFSLIPEFITYGASFYSLYTTYIQYNYNSSVNDFINIFGILFVYVIPSVSIGLLVKVFVLYISMCTPIFPRVYGIKREYKSLGKPTKPLHEIK